jgi:hypothetical protein|tara:strand:+ start:19273 stop:20007 length:735 start_codon:yes stop_codon:yes gene_type:complete
MARTLSKTPQGELFPLEGEQITRAVRNLARAAQSGAADPGKVFLLLEEGNLRPYTRPRQTTYHPAYRLFHGLMDAEPGLWDLSQDIASSGMPKELYGSLTDIEKLALWTGNGQTKYEGVRIQDPRSRSAPELVSTLVTIGYNSPPLRILRNRNHLEKGIRPGDLVRRVSELSDPKQEQIVENYTRPRAETNATRSDQFAFVDPNSDGPLDRRSSAIYISHFLTRIRRLIEEKPISPPTIELYVR